MLQFCVVLNEIHFSYVIDYLESQTRNITYRMKNISGSPRSSEVFASELPNNRKEITIQKYLKLTLKVLSPFAGGLDVIRKYNTHYLVMLRW